VPDGRQEATAFTNDDWERLANVLSQDIRAEARCLEVQLVTGLRVGDALRIRRDALAHAISTGEPVVVDTKGGKKRLVPVDGAPDVWERLLRAWVSGTGATMALWICPNGKYGDLGGYGAYQAVRRHLQKLTRELNLQGRTHLHRFRRTVAEHALHETKDIHAVQQLLGHSNLRTTEKYTHGFRGEDVADLQRRIRPGGPR
jgi:site-specific recombinase XerD